MIVTSSKEKVYSFWDRACPGPASPLPNFPTKLSDVYRAGMRSSVSSHMALLRLHEHTGLWGSCQIADLVSVGLGKGLKFYISNHVPTKC